MRKDLRRPPSARYVSHSRAASPNGTSRISKQFTHLRQKSYFQFFLVRFRHLPYQQSFDPAALSQQLRYICKGQDTFQCLV